MLAQQFQQQLFNALPLASLLLKADAPNFTIIDANEALLKIVNITSANLLIGKSVFEAFPDNPNDAAANGVSKFKASLCKTVDRGIAQEMELQRYDIAIPNTNKFIVKYWSPKNIPLFNDDASVGYILHTTIDVTDSILAKQREDQLLLTIIEDGFSKDLETNKPIGIWDLDLETNDFYWSPEFFEICGYKPYAFTPSLAKAIELIHPADLNAVTEALKNAKITGLPYRHEHRIITATNQIATVLGTGIVIKNKEDKNSRLTGFFQNITKQKEQDALLKKTLQALVESDQKYRLLFYQSPLPKWIYEIATYKIIDVNEAAIKHYGYSREEFLKLTIFDLHPAEEVHKLIAATESDRTKSTNELYRTGKYINKKKNGHIITVEISSITLEFEAKKCKFVIARDVTDIDYALKELAISNERFHYITTATSDAIWDWDLLTDKIYWGDGFETIFGYKLNEIKADTSFRLQHIHPDDVEAVMAGLYYVIYGTENQWEDKYRFKKADGTYAYVTNKGFVIRDDDGLGIRMVGAKRDMTKQREEELRLQLLESVITNASDMVVITEVGVKDGIDQQIIYVNEAFTKITGYTQQEIVGKTPRILQGPKTDRKELDKLKACLKTWQPCNITVINYTKNGEEYWVNMSISPVANASGWFTHFIAIERDVTEQVKHESDLVNAIIKTQEEERYEVGGELHDNVCQILTSSKITFKMLENYLPANKLPIFNDGIQTLNLAFKEIRNLSHRLAPVFFDESTLEIAIINTLKAFNVQGNYTINVYFDNAFKAHTTTKNFQLNLHRILQEQLNNIFKYAKANIITVIGSIKNNQLVLTISDDGIGFNTNNVVSGIGLSNMKRRAELFHGKFIIDTAPGKGCKISVEIPLENMN